MNGFSRRLLSPLCCAIALVATGCAETPPPAAAPAVAFPTREELATVPAQRPRAEAFSAVDTGSEPWTVQVEPKPDHASYDDASPWGEFLRAAVKEHGALVSLSPALKCASEELARSARRSQRLPPPNVTRFIVARCGAVVTSSRTLVWDAPADQPDAVLVESAKKSLGPRLEALLARAEDLDVPGGRHVTVGLGVVRDDKGVSVVIKVGEEEATVTSTPLRADPAHLVTVEGDVYGDYGSIDALVNQGTTGFAPCQRQGEVAAPHFSFKCRLADKDPYAWVTVLGRRPGLELPHVLASGIATAGRGPLVFKTKPAGAPALVHTPGELSAAYLGAVNRARAAAHLVPLALDPKQSAANTRLTGTLINAATSDGPKAGSDRASLGLLAGWDVEGMIRGAKLFVGAVGPTRDANALLDWTLEGPVGRATLLDPDSRVIAIGPMVPEDGSAVGATVTTYALFDSDDHRRDEAAVYKRIDAARAARGLPPAQFLTGFPEMHEHALRVAHDGASPHEEAQAMQTIAQSRSGEIARSSVLETTDLEHVALPDIATRPGELRVAVAVTHHKVPGAAWGQFVVFFVTIGENVQ